MAKIYLHIGCEKTGSTFLQETINKNSHLLRDKDILLPSHLFESSNNTEITSAFLDNKYCLGMVVPASRDLFKRQLRSFIKGNLKKNIFLSSEHLSSRLIEPNEIAELISFLKCAGHKICLICIVRQPQNWVESQYNQYIKSGGWMSVNSFVNCSLNGNPSLSRVLMCYKSVLTWVNCGLMDEIIIEEYENLRGGKMLDFFIKDVFGLERMCSLSVFKGNANHAALGWQLKIMRFINRFFPDSEFSKLNRRIAHKLRFGKKYSFSPDEIEALNTFAERQEPYFNEILKKTPDSPRKFNVIV